MKCKFLIIFTITINISAFCQENISFPLDVGNKFFYKAGHYPDNGYYGATKTITDTLDNGTRVILVNKYYTNSTTTATEYWLFTDKKLYNASSPNSFYVPIFNGYFLNDTCTSYGSPSRCYTIFDSVLFYQNHYCQSFSEGYVNHSGGTFTQVLTAANVGIFFSYYSAFSVVPPFNDVKDSTMLIGLINGGILIGDSVLTDISDTHNLIISSFNLYQNYPNPFNPETKISFSVPTLSQIKLLVYDVLGNEITTLVNEEKYPGLYTVDFRGTNISSGVYFYRLITNSISITKKFILLK